MNNLGAKLVFHCGLLTIGISCFMFGFLAKIDDHVTFIVMSFLLRTIEAVGSSATCTAAFTIIAGEFPDSVGTTFVSCKLMGRNITSCILMHSRNISRPAWRHFMALDLLSVLVLVAFCMR